MFKKKKRNVKARPKKDTIVIIGNGFDIWQGLHTCYSQFQRYYLEHREEILKKLRIKKRIYIDSGGTPIEVSDVEIIYGDPFEPRELDSDFWSTFETSLDKLDAERLNLFFGKEKQGLRGLNRSIKNANRILKEAFCGWIGTICIDGMDSEYAFGENCVFINFNYTDTLIKRFNIDEADEFHVHGEASDKESIIFGHSMHPQEPEYMLAKLGGRFEGLFYIDSILYQTDKHVQDNIQVLCMFFAMNAVMCEEIKDIYVLGHSFGPADIEYFDFLVRSSKVPEVEMKLTEENVNTTEKVNMKKERDSLDELHNRIQYVINSIGYNCGDIEPEFADAVQRKYSKEQDARNQQYQKEFFKMMGIIPNKKPELAKSKIKSRSEDAKWHISYHCDRDKVWIETVMKELGCKKYKLYPSIDECLEPFRSKR